MTLHGAGISLVATGPVSAAGNPSFSTLSATLWRRGPSRRGACSAGTPGARQDLRTEGGERSRAVGDQPPRPRGSRWCRDRARGAASSPVACRGLAARVTATGCRRRCADYRARAPAAWSAMRTRSSGASARPRASPVAAPPARRDRASRPRARRRTSHRHDRSPPAPRPAASARDRAPRGSPRRQRASRAAARVAPRAR